MTKPSTKPSPEKMLSALTEISSFMSPEEMKSESEDEYGLEYEEALEMAYENVLSIAKSAIQ